MSESRRCCMLLLVVLLGRLSLGTLNVTKSGCLGESIELFQNVRVNSGKTACSIYMNGKNNTLIGMWSEQNSTFVNGYREKIFLDKFGNIRIRNIHELDEANYFIICAARNGTTKDNVVKLDVLVAPTTNCKPIIKRVDKTLIASLEDAKECGRPEALVYFVKYPDISYENITVAMLYPGQETGIYTACIETPALRCAKISKPSEFCTYFQIHKNTIYTNQEASIHTMTVITAISLSSLIILVLVVVIQGIFYSQKWSKRPSSEADTTNGRTHNEPSVPQTAHQQLQASQHDLLMETNNYSP